MIREGTSKLALVQPVVVVKIIVSVDGCAVILEGRSKVCSRKTNVCGDCLQTFAIEIRVLTRIDLYLFQRTEGPVAGLKQLPGIIALPYQQVHHDRLSLDLLPRIAAELIADPKHVASHVSAVFGFIAAYDEIRSAGIYYVGGFPIQLFWSKGIIEKIKVTTKIATRDGAQVDSFRTRQVMAPQIVEIALDLTDLLAVWIVSIVIIGIHQKPLANLPLIVHA